MSDLLLPRGTVLRNELEIKRSRFIALVARVDSPEEARTVIESEHSATPDARHHCTAFAVTMPDSLPVMHSSDDGEPAGTAGRPMLDVLAGIPLFDVVAVVTRYFGGTLLGTGGLVRAYSESVRECLEGTPLTERVTVKKWSTLLPHGEAGRFISDFSARGWHVETEYVASGVQTTISTDDDVVAALARLSSGRIIAEPAGLTPVEKAFGVIARGVAIAS